MFILDKYVYCGNDTDSLTLPTCYTHDCSLVWKVNLLRSLNATAPEQPIVVWDLSMPGAGDTGITLADLSPHNSNILGLRKFDYSLYPPHVEVTRSGGAWVSLTVHDNNQSTNQQTSFVTVREALVLSQLTIVGSLYRVRVWYWWGFISC